VPETFTVADAKGRPVMKSAFGTEKKLPEGKYSFATVFGGKRYTQEFWINTEATTAVVFDASKIDVDKSGRPASAGRDAAQAEPAPRREAPPGPSAPVAPAAKKRFCTECGKPVAAGAKFCPNCGAKVTGG
jgi:hypothetical protein